MSELLSKGIHLDICEDETISDSSVFKTLYGLSSVPDVGGSPEKIEVTNLSDGNKRYIQGIKDYGDLEFEFYYNKEEESSAEDIRNSYQKLREIEKANKSIWWQLVYPDGTGHRWKGGVSVKRSAAGVNEALSFTASTALESEIEDITEDNA